MRRAQLAAVLLLLVILQIKSFNEFSFYFAFSSSLSLSLSLSFSFHLSLFFSSCSGLKSFSSIGNLLEIFKHRVAKRK
jgi:hypothetical protein